MSNADDLLLEIPSIHRVFGGHGGTRPERKPVSRSALNNIQNYLLSVEPTKVKADKEPSGKLAGSTRIFRSFSKSDITFVSFKVQYQNHRENVAIFI